MFKLNLKYPIVWLICLLWCIGFELNWIGIERKWIELELNWKILNPIWIRIELNWKILNPTWIRIELNWKKWIDPSPGLNELMQKRHNSILLYQSYISFTISYHYAGNVTVIKEIMFKESNFDVFCSYSKCCIHDTVE